MRTSHNSHFFGCAKSRSTCTVNEADYRSAPPTATFKCNYAINMHLSRLFERSTYTMQKKKNRLTDHGICFANLLFYDSRSIGVFDVVQDAGDGEEQTAIKKIARTRIGFGDVKCEVEK